MATNHWRGQPSTTAIKRLTKDYKDAQQNPIPGISIKVRNNKKISQK